MLVLSRKTNESIVIDGRITVKIVRVEGEVVKVGIEAPANVPVHRQEVYLEVQNSNREALTSNRPLVPRLARELLPAIQPNPPPGDRITRPTNPIDSPNPQNQTVAIV